MDWEDSRAVTDPRVPTISGRFVGSQPYYRRVPNGPFAFALFLSSYSPALLILAVRAYDHSWLLFGLSLGTAIVSGFGFLVFLKVARKGGPFRGTVADVEPRDAELAAYVATYLLPFVVVFGASIQDVLALALFLIFIGVLWVNSGLVYLNPLLAIARYHVYVVEIRPTGAGEAGTLPRSFLVTRQRELRSGDSVRPDRIGRGVLIDLGRDEYACHHSTELSS